MQETHFCSNHPHQHFESPNFKSINPNPPPPQPREPPAPPIPKIETLKSQHSIYDQLKSDRRQVVNNSFGAQFSQQLQFNQYLAQKDRELTMAFQQNSTLKLKVQRMEQALLNAENIANRLYSQLQDRDNQLTRLNGLLVEGSSPTNQFSLRNQLSNAQYQLTALQHQLTKQRQKHSYNSQSLLFQLQSKNHQISQLKRKNFDLLDHKRRLQQSLQSYEFQLTHQQQKYESQIKEKSIKLGNLERMVTELAANQKREVMAVEDRVRQKEAEVRRLEGELESVKFRGYQGEREVMELKRRLQAMEERKNMWENGEPVEEGQKRKERQVVVSERKKQREEIKVKTEGQNPEMMSPQRYSTDPLMAEFYEMGSHKMRSEQTKAASPDNYPSVKKSSKSQDMHTVSHQITESLFQSFCKCVQKANEQHLNAFLVFLQTLQSSLRSLRPLTQTFLKLSKSLHNPSSLQSLRPSPHPDINTFNLNKWIVDTLKFTKSKYMNDKHDSKREDLLAFRLLTIRYRAMFPLKGDRVEIEREIEGVLEEELVGCVGRMTGGRN